MVSRFNSYVKEHQLFTRDSKLLLAVSGGADSVLLAHLLYMEGYNFEIAHCNFCLRGEESEKDASFVQQIANRYNVSFHLKIFDTNAICEREKMSVQMAARKLRYDWFDDLCTSAYTLVPDRLRRGRGDPRDVRQHGEGWAELGGGLGAC